MATARRFQVVRDGLIRSTHKGRREAIAAAKSIRDTGEVVKVVDSVKGVTVREYGSWAENQRRRLEQFKEGADPGRHIREANEARQNRERLAQYKPSKARRRISIKDVDSLVERLRGRRVRGRPVPGSPSTRKARELLSARQCALCGRAFTTDSPRHIDHIRPVSKGGTSWDYNLQALCQDCNLAKSDHVLDGTQP